MKKIILTIALTITGLVSFAQVGVGTQEPQTSLHVVGANATSTGVGGTNTPGALAATDGITVPVVTTEMTAPGTPVNGTKDGQLVYSNFPGKTGFYYWNAGTSAWTAVGGGAAAPVRTVTVVSTAGNYSVLSTDDIIIYTGSGAANLVYPAAGFPIGKTFIVVNNSASNDLLNVATTATGASTQLSASSATTVVHVGGNAYAALHSF